MSEWTCPDCKSTITFNGRTAKVNVKVMGVQCRTCANYISKLKVSK